MKAILFFLLLFCGCNLDAAASKDQSSSKGIGPYELALEEDWSGNEAPQQDSLAFAKLDAMLQNYTEALERESAEVKSAECDFLISSVKDSLTTQDIALWL